MTGFHHLLFTLVVLRPIGALDIFNRNSPLPTLPPSSSSCASLSSPLSQLVVFGDSFSDVGRVFAASNGTQPPSPPYYPGRYSNGRNYVDFLGQKLGIAVSTDNVWAIGGATTNNSYIAGVSTYLNDLVPSIEDQVTSYLASNASNPPASTLYVVEGGYNDYWYYVNDNNATAYQEGLLEQVVGNVTNNIVHTIDTLVKAGAARLLVVDIPNMTRFPDALSKTPAQVATYQTLSTLHNQVLRNKLRVFQAAQPQADVRILALSQLFAGWDAEPDCTGLIATNEACLIDGQVCDDPFGHIFWDQWHPTTSTHYRMARAALEVLAPPPVRRRLGSTSLQ